MYRFCTHYWKLNYVYELLKGLSYLYLTLDLPIFRSVRRRKLSIAPVGAEVADQVERTGSNNDIIVTSGFDRMIERLEWVSNDGRTLGRQVSGDFE